MYFCEIYHADEKEKKTAITKNSSYGFRIDGQHFLFHFSLTDIAKNIADSRQFITIQRSHRLIDIIFFYCNFQGTHFCITVDSK